MCREFGIDSDQSDCLTVLMLDHLLTKRPNYCPDLDGNRFVPEMRSDPVRWIEHRLSHPCHWPALRSGFGGSDHRSVM